MDNVNAQTRPRVLVVNDEPDVLDVLRRLLKQDGYEVEGASDGQRALELATGAEFDVVISDVVMPLMDGVELCRRLKQDARTASVPVLLVSARRTNDDDHMFGLNAGADDYLELPFRRPELLVKVARLAERRRAEQRLNVSVAQLEALTALATAVKDKSEADRLFEGLADSITRFTDYQSSVVTLFTNAPLHHPRFLSYSSNIPTEYIAHISAGSYPRNEVRRLIEQGVRIEVGELGFAAYYPPTHYHLLDAVFPDRYKSELEKDEPQAGALWQRGDELLVPLISREGEYIGFISLDDPRSGRAPDRASVLPVVAFARQVTQLLAQQQAAETLAQQAEREALINRITLAVRRSLDPAEVFRTAVSEVGSHLGVDRCVLFMLDREAGVARSVAEYVVEGVKPAGHEYSIPLISDLARRIRQQGVLAFDDAAADESLRPIYENILHALGTRSIMYTAITVGDDTPGAFALSTTREMRHWRESDIALARAVADQTGIAIRQAELFEMVARAKQTWEATFDAMSDGVFIFDNECRLMRVNRAGAALEDETPQALLGRRCCDVLRASGGEGCIVESAIREARAVTLEYTPERLGRALLVTAEPVAEQQHAVSGTVCTVRDLSELRTVERVARERQSLLENILESAREGIYAMDTEGRLQWLNSAAVALGGYRLEDLIGQYFLDVTYEADRAMVEERFALALAGEPQTYETRYLARDGSVRCASIDNAPLVIDGRITGVLGIARDITEQKQERERAIQADKLRALGQLASGVAHDFNNALAAILGRAQLMRRMTADPALGQCLDIIETAAEDAANTVRRIRTFARQSPDEQFAQLELGELVRDAVEITRTRWENEAHARGLHYDVRLEAESALYVEGSASELREVFVNLIVNAIDAMPAGGELSIRAAQSEGSVRLFFTDIGTGMTEEVRERIFEPFYSTKGIYGTGLGLFVSYGIIERHKGQLGVQSEVGRGTTFTLDLPRVEPDDRPQAQRAGPLNEHTLSVLVVDDETFVRETLVEMLLALGHRVEASDGGRAALEALATDSFDLVFTDLSMPEMDGWEVAREIRKRWPHVCVVVVTGHGKDSVEPQGKLVDGIIGKPFNFDQVEETIANITGERMKQ
jgi:PAS domain S-box-containing protein